MSYGNYNIITLNNFYMRDRTDGRGGSLDQATPKTPAPSRETIINQLRVCNPCYAGTITMDLKIYNHLSTESMEKVIRSHFNSYTAELKQRKNVYYYAQLEYTKAHIPHIHLLTNGYRSIFLRHFSALGKANKHENSYQKVKHFDEYVEYMDKPIDYKRDGTSYYYTGKEPMFG